MNPRQERPISDYGLIGNCRTAALVSTEGSIDWCCLPRFDSDSFFCSILDPKIGGRFSITPLGNFRSKHSYVPGTNVLVTRFETSSGSAELMDCFTVTDEITKRQGLWPDHEILRKLRCHNGSLKFRMIFYPTEKHGFRGMDLIYKKNWGIISRERHQILALQTNIPSQNIRIEKDENQRSFAVAEFEIFSGQDLWFSVIFENDEPAVWVPLGECAEERLFKTLRYWKNWINQCTYQGHYEKEVRRSALTLKLLTFAPSGAIIAAPTTSLPEWIGGTRNWDYRYCWLRDASFTVRVLIHLGFSDEARAYVNWLIHSTKLARRPWNTHLQALYGVFGENKILETTIPWLSGYKNSRPVRIGNAAKDQVQIDIYGEVVESIKLLSPFLDEIDHDTRKLILDIGGAVLKLWDQPDDGIWEPRRGRQQHTHSKVLSWVALKNVSDLAKHYKWKTKHRCETTSEKVREAIESFGYNSTLQAYTQTFNGSDLDSSLLVLPMVGYCDAKAPRFQSTLNAIMKNLSHNQLVYRYKPETDGIHGTEGAFDLCTFWLAEALFRSGRISEGHQWFQYLLNKSGHEIGLWLEEIDPDSNSYLGNYPQGFSHVGLINAAIAATKAEAA